MEAKMIKKYSHAFDSLYDLNSACAYKYQDMLDRLEDDVFKKGYEFVLNQKTQKIGCKKCKGGD